MQAPSCAFFFKLYNLHRQIFIVPFLENINAFKYFKQLFEFKKKLKKKKKKLVPH